jgi:hypothetical protein
MAAPAPHGASFECATPIEPFADLQALGADPVEEPGFHSSALIARTPALVTLKRWPSADTANDPVGSAGQRERSSVIGCVREDASTISIRIIFSTARSLGTAPSQKCRGGLIGGRAN